MSAQLFCAIKRVQEGGISIRKAALQHSVNRCQLSRAIKREATTGIAWRSPGRPQLITESIKKCVFDMVVRTSGTHKR